jgi:predicted Zn-dependent protease
MSRKLIFEAIVLVLVFASIWGIFSLFPIFPDRSDFSISLTSEEKLGKLLLSTIVDHPEYKPISTKTLDSAIAQISNRLVKATGLTDYDYRIVVVDNPEINAFTLPGGNILVTSALIRFTESPEELAAVLAHEMGHAEKKHVVSRLLKEFTLALILSDKAVLSEASRTVTSTAFDRRQEEEADDYSLRLLEKANINPRLLGTFFSRLRDEENRYDEKLTILMTHPTINSRIKAAFEYKTEVGFHEKGFGLDWNRIKNLLPQKEKS